MATLDTRVETALRRWGEARGRGESPRVEELCAEWPELVEIVRDRIAVMESRDTNAHVPGRERPVSEGNVDRIGSGHDAEAFDVDSIPDVTQIFPVKPSSVTSRGKECSTIPGPESSVRGRESFFVAHEFSELELHATGGLGEVYAARDGSTRRRIALKTVRAEFADVADVAERLLLEAEVTARLEHPGVVPVHGLGRSSTGRPFYVMQFVEGRTLDEAIEHHFRPDNRQAGQQGSFEFHTLLNQFVSVCKTIAYAHNRGIVHRDVKPQNVLLGRFGETIVADWGLAIPVRREEWARASGERTLAVGAPVSPETAGSKPGSGSGVGTPAYMSPEQATGRYEIGPASDVYNLGATLYKVITGRNPFDGDSVQSILHRVSLGEFDLPSTVNKQLSGALEAICLKAMAAEPRDRYQTALALADDVEKFLADDTVSAYDEPLGRRVARWARRHRAATRTVLLLLVFVMFGGLTAAWVLGNHAVREAELHARAAASAAREHDLREGSLRASAEFAARSLANQVDVRWRVLERETADPEVARMLLAINANPNDPELRKPLQAWLDRRGPLYNASVRNRAMYVNALDGRQVARFPSHDSTGEMYDTLQGGSYAFRDYFNGLGRDLEPGRAAAPFEADVHVSTVHESTNDGLLSVVFGTPIRDPESGRSIGILSMSVAIGDFADLDVTLPPGQSVLLVDTRQYALRRAHPTPHEEWCEGLVLHHAALGDLRNLARLPRVRDTVLARLLAHRSAEEADSSSENLLARDYHDPLASNDRARWLAAFAPVDVLSRPKALQGTGWFVIVQQMQQE